MWQSAKQVATSHVTKQAQSLWARRFPDINHNKNLKGIAKMTWGSIILFPEPKPEIK